MIVTDDEVEKKVEGWVTSSILFEDLILTFDIFNRMFEYNEKVPVDSKVCLISEDDIIQQEVIELENKLCAKNTGYKRLFKSTTDKTKVKEKHNV